MNQKNESLKLKLTYLFVMVMFGIMGPIVRAIGLPSPVIACLRAWISSICLILYMVITKHPFDRNAVKWVLVPMSLCGLYMAIDWIGLFESYNYTTIATATVCYYITPVLVFLASPFLLKEPFTIRHFTCTLVAFVGMAFVSGIFEPGALGSASQADTIKGILFALLGAAGYAAIILTNKKHPDGDPIIRTTIQLSVAAILTTPYVFIRYDVSALHFTLKGVLFLLLLSVVLTAALYIVYFSTVVRLPARSVAILSYVDPVTAVFVSIFFLGEKITVFGVIGTVLIIGAAIVSELSPVGKLKA